VHRASLLTYFTLSLHDALPISFLAKEGKDRAELPLGSERDDIRGARPGTAHAHVERALEAEREAALGFFELHRGHPEIEQNALDRGKSEVSRNLVERGEIRLDQGEPPEIGRAHV